MSETDEKAQKWLQRVGLRAMRQLWSYSNSDDTPMAEKAKLWQYMAEMAYGKPRTMDAAAAIPPGGCGVVILPAVEAVTNDTDGAQLTV